MGRQNGAVEIRGVVGGLQFGKNSDGSPGVKRARVFNRAAMKKGRNYVRTRENNQEFTGSARAANALRKALGPRVRLFGDNQLFARLVSLTHLVLTKGPGAGGERKLEVQPNLAEFVDLEYHDREVMSTRFQAPFTVSVNTGRNTATVDVPAFDPDYMLTLPGGATDFRLVVVAGVMSDFSFTGNSRKYAADNPDLAGLSVLVESALLPVNALTSALQLVAALPGTPTLPTGTALLVSLGIEFFRTINSQSKVLASGNAMRVVGAY